jgi:hypothetical protein
MTIPPPSTRKPWDKAWKPALAALATGALIVVAAPGVAPNKACAWLAWLALAPLAMVLPRLRPMQGARLGWIAGFVVNAGSCAWFPALLARFGNLHPALAIGIGILLWAYHALP